MDRLFVDTGAWFAFFNRGDPDHEPVAEVLTQWQGRLVTSDYVFDELVTLLRYRVGHSRARRGGDVVRSNDIVVMVAVESGDIEQAWKQFVRHHDKRYSFTDCTSFAVMKRLGLSTAAAVDADFRRSGLQTLPR